MSEASAGMSCYQKWDVGIKLVGFTVTIFLAFLAYTEYANKADADKKAEVGALEQRKREFNLRFYERQMATYSDLCEVIGGIVSKKNLGEAEKDIQRFDQLFWGRLPMLMDEGVQSAVNEFGGELRKLRNDKPSVPSRLKDQASYVIHACRNSLRSTFSELKIGELKKEHFDFIGH